MKIYAKFIICLLVLLFSANSVLASTLYYEFQIDQGTFHHVAEAPSDNALIAAEANLDSQDKIFFKVDTSNKTIQYGIFIESPRDTPKMSFRFATTEEEATYFLPPVIFGGYLYDFADDVIDGVNDPMFVANFSTWESDPQSFASFTGSLFGRETNGGTYFETYDELSPAMLFAMAPSDQVPALSAFEFAFGSGSLGFDIVDFGSAFAFYRIIGELEGQLKFIGTSAPVLPARVPEPASGALLLLGLMGARNRLRNGRQKHEAPYSV